MAGRPGFLGGMRQGGAPEWGSENSREQDPLATSGFRFSDSPRIDARGNPPGFDPVWGTLGAPTAQTIDPWTADPAPETIVGRTADVEILGAGFEVSGQINTGHFDRVSDWLNMQTGFIQVQEASHTLLGREVTPDSERVKGTLWIRLDKIVLMAERSAMQQTRAGAQVIQKQRRKVRIVTAGYQLRGSLHLHAAVSMVQFLATPEPHFLPITELTVHWVDNPQLAARFPFAVINREQIVTILDEPAAPVGETEATDGERSQDRAEVAGRRWGAA